MYRSEGIFVLKTSVKFCCDVKVPLSLSMTIAITKFIYLLTGTDSLKNQELNMTEGGKNEEGIFFMKNCTKIILNK